MNATETYKPSGAELTLALIISVGALFWGGYVALKLWAWFLLPLGAPVVSFWGLMGLRATVSFLRGIPYRKDPPLDEAEWTTKCFAYPLMLPTFAPGFGALYRWLAQ